MSARAQCYHTPMCGMKEFLLTILHSSTTGCLVSDYQLYAECAGYGPLLRKFWCEGGQDNSIYAACRVCIGDKAQLFKRYPLGFPASSDPCVIS